MKVQTEFIDSETCKSLTHIKKDSVELTLMRCGYEECDAGHIYGPHKKSYYMLYGVTEGTCIAKIDGCSYQLEKQDIIMTFPEQECRFQAASDEKWSCVWLGFSGMKAHECAIYSGFSVENPVLRIEHVEQIRKAVERMIEAREETFSNLLVRNGLLKIFFAELIEFHNRKYIEEQLESVKDTGSMQFIKELGLLLLIIGAINLVAYKIRYYYTARAAEGLDERG